jgi:hypothetical protein
LYGSNPVFGSNGDLKLYRANPKAVRCVTTDRTNLAD